MRQPPALSRPGRRGGPRHCRGGRVRPLERDAPALHDVGPVGHSLTDASRSAGRASGSARQLPGGASPLVVWSVFWACRTPACRALVGILKGKSGPAGGTTRLRPARAPRSPGAALRIRLPGACRRLDASRPRRAGPGAGRRTTLGACRTHRAGARLPRIELFTLALFGNSLSSGVGAGHGPGAQGVGQRSSALANVATKGLCYTAN